MINKLCKKYVGLQSDDLSQTNPEYSCIICCIKECDHMGSNYGSCQSHRKCTVSEFSLRYNFK